MPGYRGAFTCGHCQLICHPDPKVRKERFAALVSSGVVVQDPGGGLRAVSPEEATAHLAAMDEKTRALYQ